MLEIISPILKSINELFVSLVKAIFEGFADMVDNWKSIVFVVFVGLMGVVIGHTYLPNDVTCSKTIKELRKDYVFVPRKKTQTTKEWWQVF